ADLAEVIRQDPSKPDAVCNRATVYAAKKEFAKAIADFDRIIKLDPNNVGALNGLGWLLATCTADGCRNGKRSVELATKACDLTKWKDFEILDTLPPTPSVEISSKPLNGKRRHWSSVPTTRRTTKSGSTSIARASPAETECSVNAPRCGTVWWPCHFKHQV